MSVRKIHSYCNTSAFIRISHGETLFLIFVLPTTCFSIILATTHESTILKSDCLPDAEKLLWWTTFFTDWYKSLLCYKACYQLDLDSIRYNIYIQTNNGWKDKNWLFFMASWQRGRHFGGKVARGILSPCSMFLSNASWFKIVPLKPSIIAHNFSSCKEEVNVFFYRVLHGQSMDYFTSITFRT